MAAKACFGGLCDLSRRFDAETAGRRHSCPDGLKPELRRHFSPFRLHRPHSPQSAIGEFLTLPPSFQIYLPGDFGVLHYFAFRH